jgi:hypothetical protein
MKENETRKIVLLSIAFAVLLIPIALLLYVGIMWFINHTIIGIMDWLNSLYIFFKVLIIVLSGLMVLWFVLSPIKAVRNILSHSIFYKFPKNTFTEGYSEFIFVICAESEILRLWKSYNHLNVGVEFELIIISLFLLSANIILMPWYMKKTSTGKSAYSLF